MINKYTLSSLLATGAMVLPSSGATLVAINFLRSATTTPAANDGSEYGIDVWEDVLVTPGSATVDGIGVSWDVTGGWNGGGNNVENGYMDNAGVITLSGLSAWLTANNAVSYTIQTIGASDTASNWFGDTLLRDTDGAGVLLDTLTNSNLQRGLSSESTDLTADVLLIDPTAGGTAPDGGGGARTNVAGLIITATIPEPSATLLCALAGLGLVARRRR